MPRIADLPKLEKPLEKAIRYGVNTLSNEELLALIINSGTINHSVLDLARGILSNSCGLIDLYNQPYQFFLKYPGIKETKAIRLAATFEIAKRVNLSKENESSVVLDSSSLYRKYAPNLMGKNYEVFILVILNKKHRVLHEETIFVGSEENVSFSSKDVLCTLLLYKASYFYMIHNHPNNSLSPSQSDIEITQEIMNQSGRIGIHLVDHIIIGDSGYYSFKQEKIFLNKNE